MWVQTFCKPWEKLQAARLTNNEVHFSEPYQDGKITPCWLLKYVPCNPPSSCLIVHLTWIFCHGNVKSMLTAKVSWKQHSSENVSTANTRSFRGQLPPAISSFLRTVHLMKKKKLTSASFPEVVCTLVYAQLLRGAKKQKQLFCGALILNAADWRFLWPGHNT